MSGAKFTNGTWVADIRSGCCAVYPESRETDTAGCHYYDDRNIYYSSHEASYNGHHWVMSDEAVANAYLIASSPEMYEEIEHEYAVLLWEIQNFIVEDKEGEKKLRKLQVVANRKAKILAKARGEGV